MLGSHLSFREVKIRSLTATSTCTSGAPLDDWWSWCQWRRWRLLGVLYSFSNALACSRVSHTWAWEWPASSLDCHHVLRAGVHLRDNLLWPGRHCLTSYLEKFRLWWIPLFLRCWWRPRLWTSFPANNSWELASFRGSLTFECETQGRVTSCVCLPRSSRPPWSPSLVTICLIFWNKVNGY